MNLNWNFLGEGGCKTKTLLGGSMDIFWNYHITTYRCALFHTLFQLLLDFRKHHWHYNSTAQKKTTQRYDSWHKTRKAKVPSRDTCTVPALIYHLMVSGGGQWRYMGGRRREGLEVGFPRRGETWEIGGTMQHCAIEKVQRGGRWEPGLKGMGMGSGKFRPPVPPPPQQVL